MTRLIYFLFFVFMVTWVLQCKFTERKVEEIKQASEHIEERFNELDATLKSIRKRMDDDESWQQVRKSLKQSIEP